MTSDILTVQERIDMMKLAKSLALVAAQIIVQSRDGNKANTKCSITTSGHTTFNVATKELLEVDKEVKRTLGLTHSDRWSPLCVEILLKTVDDDILTLETWTVSLEPDRYDHSKSFTIYSRLGILLKSLLAITRVIPAYRYSRRQSDESYVITYKIYSGEPQLHLLGEKYKQLKVGSVSTPVGSLQLNVAYRTVMTISPQLSGIDESIMVKSDHFRPDPGLKSNGNEVNEDSLISDESAYKIGAFAESRRESIAVSDTEQLIPSVPFSSLLTPKASAQQSPSTQDVPLNSNELCDRLKVLEVKDEVATPAWSSVNDDYIMVDIVKSPFAASSGNIELGTFYHEWETAPELQACQNDPPVIEQVGDLTKQLATYEDNLKEYDNMVSSLCDSDKVERLESFRELST